MKASKHDKQLEKQITRFIKDQWFVIAAMAWDGYTHEGRGVLVFEGIPPQRRFYAPLAKAKHHGETGREIAAFLAQWAETYNPDTSVAIAVMYPERQRVHCDIDTDIPPPPDAYRIYHAHKATYPNGIPPYEGRLFDPETADEWQKAVNLAAALLRIKDALKDDGLEGGKSPVLDKEIRGAHMNVITIERCQELLTQGARWGIVPQPGKVAAHLKNFI